MDPLWMVAILVALVLGFATGLKLHTLRSKNKVDADRDRLIEEARGEADAIREAAEHEARETVLREKEKVEQEHAALQQELKNRERELGKRDADLKGQQQRMTKKDKDIARREKSVTQKEQAAESAARNAEARLGEAKQQLELVAGMSREQARVVLKEEVIDEARALAAVEVKKIEEETEAECDARAKSILVTAISRFAGDYVSERTVSVVQLASDDMKGRIIGREGRNIRALEAATGVDLIIDDTPEAVIISCFNPVRREIARMALSRLIADGRIHPSRIEEIARKCEKEVDALCKEDGEQAIFDLGLHKIHPELVKVLGSLRFRSSYAQNLLQHSVEVGFLAGMMASELGVNVKMARRAGLLHDIGKGVDHQQEGSHADVGASVAKKFNEPPRVISAIASHHGQPAPGSINDHLVHAANALSARRPGARREALASFIQRLEDLETLAKSFPGITRAYAIQAGREVRILVDTNMVSDDQTRMLAKEIARKVENDVNYPGQICVNVIRESRATDTAR
ncbi:MAG: ribonuclease Y [bacterium]